MVQVRACLARSTERGIPAMRIKRRVVMGTWEPVNWQQNAAAGGSIDYSDACDSDGASGEPTPKRRRSEGVGLSVSAERDAGAGSLSETSSGSGGGGDGGGSGGSSAGGGHEDTQVACWIVAVLLAL